MSEFNRFLNLAGIKTIMEDTIDNISVFIKATITHYIADAEDVEGYQETNDERHGHEVHWAESWEKDAIQELSRCKAQLETTVGIFDIVDWDPQEKSLRHGSGGIWYDGSVEFWVEIPKEIAKSKEHLEEIIKNSRILLFCNNQTKPEIIEPKKLDIYDYDFSGEFTENFNPLNLEN
jgi:hypothetical protein